MAIVLEAVSLSAASPGEFLTGDRNPGLSNFKTLFFKAFEIAHIIFTTLRLENWTVPV
jgi:hypothetical protein